MAIWSLQLLTEQYCRRLTTQSLTAADLYKTQKHAVVTWRLFTMLYAQETFE